MSPRLLALLLLLPAPALAQAPPGYYAGVNDATPTTLRNSLHAIIDDHQRFPYTSGSTDTWDILKKADEDPSNSGRILDVYRNASYQKVSGGGGSYNREHTWPNSYGFPDDGGSNYPYTDCHQLFLCDTGYNSSRGSKLFADGDGSWNEFTTLSNGGVGGGSGAHPGWSNWSNDGTDRFEVWNDRKGDVARALLYLDVRYEGGNHGVTGHAEPDLILTNNASLVYGSATGNNESVAYMGMLSTLLAWHAADPVDAKERARNDEIFAYQGNRNPFIDNPEWVDCLFNGTCGDLVPPATPTGLGASFGSGFSIVDWADNTETDLAGYRLRRTLTGGTSPVEVTPDLILGSGLFVMGLTGGVSYDFEVAAEDTSGNLSAWSAPASTTTGAGGCGSAAYDLGASPVNTIVLGAFGNPAVGGVFDVEAVGVPGFGGFLGVSLGRTNLPLLGGAVLVDPLALVLPLQFKATLTGDATWPLAVPNDAAYAGLKVHAQVFALDVVQPGGYSLSNGLELTVCP